MLLRRKRANVRQVRRLFYAQQGFMRVRGRGIENEVHRLRLWIEADLAKVAGVEREPQAVGREIDAHAERIERRDFDRVLFFGEIAAEREPAEIRAVGNVGSCVEGVAEEVRPVVAGVWIKREHVREGMECRGGEA